MVTQASARVRGADAPTRRRGTIAPPLIGLALLLTAWEVGLRLADAPNYLTPKPSDVVAAVGRNWDVLLEAFARTAIASVAGFTLATLFGIGGALLLSFSRTLERMLFPYAVVVQTVPTVSIAPLLVIWIGPGMRASIAVSLILGFFAIFSNSLVGLNSIEPDRANLLKLYGASKWKVIRKLRFPGALPYVMAGLRISAGLSVIGTIVGEFVAGVGGGEGGLGFVVQLAGKRLDTPYLVGAALAAGTLGVSFCRIVRQASKRLLSWHESAIPQEGAPGRGRGRVPSGSGSPV